MRHGFLVLLGGCIVPTSDGVTVIHHPALWVFWVFVVGGGTFWLLRAIEQIGVRRAARRYEALMRDED